MPAPLRAWYSLRDIETLAHRDAVLSGDIQLDELKRLSGLLHEPDGSVRVSVRFASRGHEWQALELEFEASVRLTCQRCLEPLELRLAERVALGIVESDSMQEYLPDGYEPIVLAGERLCPTELLEDEMIVSLPLVPRHDGEEFCEMPTSVVATSAPGNPAGADQSSANKH